jgi:hypothetical protein
MLGEPAVTKFIKVHHSFRLRREPRH